MGNIFQHCDFCSKPIKEGQPYGTLVYNTETFSRNADYPAGAVDVHSSEQVHIMCLACGIKYNRENVEEEINQIANQGFKEVKPIAIENNSIH